MLYSAIEIPFERSKVHFKSESDQMDLQLLNIHKIEICEDGKGLKPDRSSFNNKIENKLHQLLTKWVIILTCFQLYFVYVK